jgi:hypothetical protein
MRASRYKDGNFPLIPAYYLVISYIGYIGRGAAEIIEDSCKGYVWRA